jgi:hypothetical protein
MLHNALKHISQSGSHSPPGDQDAFAWKSSNSLYVLGPQTFLFISREPKIKKKVGSHHVAYAALLSFLITSSNPFSGFGTSSHEIRELVQTPNIFKSTLRRNLVQHCFYKLEEFYLMNG